jgi:hypothetical protein
MILKHVFNIIILFLKDGPKGEDPGNWFLPGCFLLNRKLKNGRGGSSSKKTAESYRALLREHFSGIPERVAVIPDGQEFSRINSLRYTLLKVGDYICHLF